GNAYLGGIDPIAWLGRIKHRLVHVHAKDITLEQSDAERGKVMGTPVGCACGDGVIDWAAVVSILRAIPQDIVLSVECGTLDQAARSVEHLRKVVR
ncbi:MAG: sugar phosphate isomerase/epimerase, partial [Thermoguttaceae bacterium]